MLADGLLLAIETSNPSSWTPASPWRPGAALARVAAGKVVADVDFEPVAVDRPRDDDLMGAIDRLCGRAGAVPRDLKTIAVSSGPGGFTSVRIAVTIAKTIAEATGAACVGVPTAHVAAQAVEADGPFAVALASKGETAFVTVFEDRDHARGEGALVHAAGLQGLGVRTLIADRFLPGAMRGEAGKLGIEVREPVFDAAACARAAVLLQPMDPAVLVPLYPREPEAVTRWRAMRGEG